MSKRFFMVMTGALALFAVNALCAAPTEAADNPKFFKILSTSPGGLWHTFGTQLTEKLQKRFPDITFSHVPGGSDKNHKLVSTGQAQMGFSYTPVSLDAWNGKGQFDQQYQNVRVIGTFYPAFLHAVVRRDIGVKSMSDLKGKVISPGKREWASTKVVMQILQTEGITEKSGTRFQYLGFKDVENMMEDRRLDAFMYYGSVPSPLLLKLSETPGIDIPPYTQAEVDQALAVLKPKGAFTEMSYPENPYKGVKGGFPCPVMWSIFVVSANLPDDLVYGITKIIYEDPGLRKFMGGGPSLNVKLATASLKGGAIPFHPGAIRYLKEHGAW